MTVLVSDENSASNDRGDSTAAVETPRFQNNYFDGLPVTKRHRKIFILVMIAYFFDQFDNWNFGYIAPGLRSSWGLSLEQIATITTVYFYGMTIGGLIGGFLSDRIGRRRIFLYGMMVFSIASVVNGLTSNLAVFTIARGITGIGLFSMMVCSHTYLAELAPGESRGRWQGRVAAIGYCAVPVIGVAANLIIPISHEAWRWLFLLGGLGVIPLVLAWRWLPESPRWLAAQGRVSEAEDVVNNLTGRNIELTAAASQAHPAPSIIASLRGIFSRRLASRTVVLLVLFALETPASFIVRTWITTLLDARGLSIRTALIATFLMQIGVPVGCWISSRISDKGGRKWPIVGLLLAESSLALIFGHAGAAWWLIVTGFFLTASGMAVGFISYTYAAENYPTELRNAAGGMHNAVGRAMVAAVQPGIPALFAAGGFSVVFTTISIAVLPAALIVGLLGKRTGGKSLEEIS